MPKTHSHGQLAHFSINTNDMDRAQAFYSAVFGWQFQAFGPPAFFMVAFPNQASAPIQGSIQARRELVPGTVMTGLECTFAVDDIDVAIREIQTHGGQIVLPKCTLPGIGHMTFFKDPEGNVAGAMEYDTDAV